MHGAAQWRVGDPAPPPLPRRSEADVVARWQDGPPLVSVLCPTYQHVGFIEDALRGFLGQDTDFPFEVIVRDDASTDGTAEKVRDFAEQYPSIVRAVLETTNRFGSVNPLRELFALASGRFLATCEGDDYWIVPSKLARQVSAFEERGEVSVVCHPTLEVTDGVITMGWEPEAESTVEVRIPARHLRTAEGRRQNTSAKSPMHTSAVMFRNLPWPSELFDARVNHFDLLRNQWLGVLGDGVVIEGLVASAYRRHATGLTMARITDSDQQPEQDRVRSSLALRRVGANDAAEAAARSAILELASRLGIADWRNMLGVALVVLRSRAIGHLTGGPLAAPMSRLLRLRRRVLRISRTT